MNPLIDDLSKLMIEYGKQGEEAKTFNQDILYFFIERLTFSSYDEIVAMLDYAELTHWSLTPVWLRNLAYRLACLLEPNNADIKHRAAGDLLCFGPDWDEIAAKLHQEADEIEAITGIKDPW